MYDVANISILITVCFTKSFILNNNISIALKKTCRNKCHIKNDASGKSLLNSIYLPV